MATRRRMPPPKTARSRALRAAHSKEKQESHLGSVLVPWFLGLFVFGLGGAAHRLWGKTLPTTAVATPLITIAGGLLTLLTWNYAKAREPIARWHATLTVAAAALAVLITVIVGLHRPWIDLYLGGAVVSAISWNIRWLRSIRGDGDDSHGGREDGWGEVLGLPGSTAKIKTHDGVRAEVALRFRNGQTAADAQRATAAITSYASLPPGGARVIPDPDHADEGTLVVVTKDVLKKRLAWPGPSHPGGSITEPIHLGLYEDGQEEKLLFPSNWDPKRKKSDETKVRNAIHLLIMGMSGAGKTIAALIIATEILTRRNVVLWWCDVVKGMQSARPIRSGIDWFVTKEGDAKRMLNAVDRIIAYRANLLGELGYREWCEESGLPYLIVWIEEATKVIQDSDTFVRLTEAARSVGISLVISMQRASHDNIPTSARSNLGAVLCFGVRDDTDAGFALSEETLAAGAQPSRWKSDKPGYHYHETSAVESQRWATPARTYDEEDLTLQRVVESHRETRCSLDEGSAAAAGQPYHEREMPSETPAAPSAPTTATPRRPVTPDPYDDDDDEDTMYEDDPNVDPRDRIDYANEPDDSPYRIPDQPEAALAEIINPRAPIDQVAPDEPDVDFSLGDPDSPDLSREQKEQIFNEILESWVGKNGRVIRMQDMVDLWITRTGQAPNQGRPFLHEMINKKIQQGQMSRDEETGRGRYMVENLAVQEV